MHQDEPSTHTKYTQSAHEVGTFYEAFCAPNKAIALGWSIARLSVISPSDGQVIDIGRWACVCVCVSDMTNKTELPVGQWTVAAVYRRFRPICTCHADCCRWLLHLARHTQSAIEMRCLYAGRFTRSLTRRIFVSFSLQCCFCQLQNHIICHVIAGGWCKKEVKSTDRFACAFPSICHFSLLLGMGYTLFAVLGNFCSVFDRSYEMTKSESIQCTPKFRNCHRFTFRSSILCSSIFLLRALLILHSARAVLLSRLPEAPSRRAGPKPE